MSETESAVTLDARADDLMAQALELRRQAAARRGADAAEARRRATKIPVDRSDRTLADGSAISEDHRDLKPNGQQKDYVVLSDAERAKGFVRPVRQSYRHTKCGGVTTMSRPIAETYARDPYFYSGTFCVDCGKHFPVGDEGEFVWIDAPDEKVGT